MRVRVAAAADPVLSAANTPARPNQGQYVVLSLVVDNSEGAAAGSFTLTADLVRSDNSSVVEGHFFSQPGGGGSQTISGTVAAGATQPVTLYSGGIADQSAFSPPLTSLDIIVTLTADGSSTVYAIADAVAVPAAQAALQVTGVSVGVGG